jgi:hypothetical protein
MSNPVIIGLLFTCGATVIVIGFGAIIYCAANRRNLEATTIQDESTHSEEA